MVNEQPEAVTRCHQLADKLQYQVELGSYNWDRAESLMLEAAAELRRLHKFEVSARRCAESDLAYINKLEALNQELLKALRNLVEVTTHLDPCPATLDAARAAITKAEGAIND